MEIFVLSVYGYSEIEMVMINWKQDFLSSNSVGHYTRDKQIGSYDYRPNWTSLGSFTIIYGKGGGESGKFQRNTTRFPRSCPPLPSPSPLPPGEKKILGPQSRTHKLS